MKRVNNKIRKFLINEDLSYASIAQMLGIKHGTFVNRMSKGNFSVEEMIKITAAGNAKIAIVKGDKIVSCFEEEDLM